MFLNTKGNITDDVNISKIHDGDLINVRQSQVTISSREPTSSDLFQGLKFFSDSYVKCDKMSSHARGHALFE